MFPNEEEEYLPGSLHEYYVTREGKRYGPYWRRKWREDGKQKSAYVRAADLEQVRAAIERYKSVSALDLTGMDRMEVHRFKWNYIDQHCPIFREVREMLGKAGAGPLPIIRENNSDDRKAE